MSEMEPFDGHATVVHRPEIVSETLSIDDLVAEGDLIEQVMQRVMREGEHYGVIPGTDKPTLLKPGAEKLCRTFKLAPTYPPERLQRDYLDDDHYNVVATCVLLFRPTGQTVAEGLGQCTSKEEKYAFRGQEFRVCPECGAAAVVKSTRKNAYFCISKEGGCGKRFAFGSTVAKEQLDTQEVGKRPNDRLPDTWNTILKMACKRALVAAVLNGTAASDVFTQDLEDQQDSGAAAPREAPESSQAAAPDGEGAGAADVPAPADLTMTFGAHQGARVGDLPLDYLYWLAGRVSDDETAPFVPDDEYGAQLQEAAKETIPRLEKAQAITNLNSVFTNLIKADEERVRDGGMSLLPPGHDDWPAYLRWYIEGLFHVDLNKVNWRDALETDQIRVVTAHLMEMEVPL